MPRTTYVVKYNETTDVYLTGWTGELTYANCSWGALSAAMEFGTQVEADDIATAINSGTVGLPKPH